ncbi:ankyrin repeat-containing domain [Fusarium longipes]|uniref:Ankyrin repeat-containing domain n=1 Tax=Fusarium longipes TaxID=694270 RepID=A0A395SHM2_9HYPO|nr:ankyrin repeat-containing domain [Fusarium longipes]
MTKVLDLLPTEILDSILDELETVDIISLWKSNKLLSHRLNDRLFAHPIAINNTMRWACGHGDPDVIRAAISHGAHPSHVLIPPNQRAFGLARDSHPRVPKTPYKASTLYIAITHDHENALDVLLEMGARIEKLSARQRDSLSYHFRHAPHRSGMLRKLINADLAWFATDPFDAGRSIMRYIESGHHLDNLRSLSRGQDLNLVLRETMLERSQYAICPLSAAIDTGRKDVVEMLLEEGADIHGSLECYDPSRKGSKKQRLIKYYRPLHIPIFAAASYMASTGSSEMLDLCLQHGADINQKGPALIYHDTLGNHFISTPLTTYLEGILKFPVNTQLKPIDGIKYFLDRGALIQPPKSVEGEEWPWFASGTWLDFQEGELCQPLSMVEVLLGKWHLEKLRTPQFLETVKYLVSQGSGVERAESIIRNFSLDSAVTNLPLPHNHPDHPNNVRVWWDVIHQLWDKLDEVHGHDYAWLDHSFNLGGKAKRLISAGIETQEQKDKLLYETTINSYLYQPQHYGTLSRLVIDRQIALGADINAFVGDKGETLLFYVCDQINNAFIKGGTDDIESDYRHPEMTPIFQTKLQELVLSLINKGADPRMPVDDWTSYHVLKRDFKEARTNVQSYLVDLIAAIEEARDVFLQNGPLSNCDEKQKRILDFGLRDCRFRITQQYQIH